MDTIRTLHSFFISLFGGMLLLVFAYIMIRKAFENNKEEIKIVNFIFRWIIIIGLVISFFYLGAFLIVNKAPRSVINRSAVEERKDNFEETTKKIVAEKNSVKKDSTRK